MKYLASVLTTFLLVVLAGIAHADPKSDMLAAVEKNDIPAIKAALAAGADVNAPLDDGRTALMLAAANGSMPMAQYLLYRGADLYLRDNNGKHAGKLAKANDHNDIAKLLSEEEHPLHTSASVTMDISSLNVTPDLFKDLAKRALVARRWTMESADAGVVTGVLMEGARAYKVELRYVPPRIYLSYLKGYGSTSYGWLFSMAKEMLIQQKVMAAAGH